MTERQQRRQACTENEWLSRENHKLRADVLRADERIAELEIAHSNVLVERDAADVLLGAAMDKLNESGYDS